MPWFAEASQLGHLITMRTELTMIVSARRLRSIQDDLNIIDLANRHQCADLSKYDLIASAYLDR